MGNPLTNPQAGNRLEADGQLWVICSICGRRIQKIVYGMNGQRFSTAICYYCDKGLVLGKTPDELIYERIQEERRLADQVRDDIGPNMFKAKGFKQRVIDVVSDIKKNIAQRRRKITEE